VRMIRRCEAGQSAAWLREVQLVPKRSYFSLRTAAIYTSGLRNEGTAEAGGAVSITHVCNFLKREGRRGGDRHLSKIHTARNKKESPFSVATVTPRGTISPVHFERYPYATLLPFTSALCGFSGDVT
jgi:hypothetical protein